MLMGTRMITKPKNRQPIGLARYPTARDKEQVEEIKRKAKAEEDERLAQADKLLKESNAK